MPKYAISYGKEIVREIRTNLFYEKYGRALRIIDVSRYLVGFALIGLAYSSTL